MRKSAIAVLLLVLLGNVGVWALANRPVSERPWVGIITGVAYSPYHANQGPQSADQPRAEDIEHDMQMLQGKTRSVRIYTALGATELVPAIARKYGLSVTAGAWIQGKPDIDEPEITNLIRIANANRNVKRVIVGNEAVLRADVTVPQIIEDIKRVKNQVRVPVSTAEPWHVWLAHPELVDAVDFIAIHLLPYWEGVPVDQAVAYALQRYDEVHTRYPGKRILISEVGWPSDGPWRRGAEASLVNQAQFSRIFLNAAVQHHLDYYVMEAFDQPWKRTLEGAAGTAWGLWSADRLPKFPMAGDVVEVPDWPVLCAIASGLAFLPMLWFVTQRTDLRRVGQFLYAALIQASASVLVLTAVAAMSSGLATSTEIAWGVLVFAQVLLLAVMLIDGLELTEVVFRRRFDRWFEPVDEPPPANAPMVSIHVPCYNEPPHMVIETMRALAKLDYPNYEVLIIDNNTKDEAVWRPLEAACAQFGPRFRFFHLPNWPGYKAGALNFGLEQTDPEAEFIAVIDSDYQVSPDWLSGTVPYFANPRVGFVQSPQDYREWEGDLFKRMINWEYAGFFHIGMVQRNERNAIIQHGTMTIIRKTALEEVGRWGEWCITEDADLGLRLFENRYKSVYMSHSFGKGLVPDSFSGYKTQRFRWAYGAIQIMKRHWKDFLPGARRLTFGQKYHFVTGWLPWLADAAHLTFGAASIIWSIGLLTLPKYFEFPPTAFLVPTLAVFAFKVAAGLWLYEARVKCSALEKVGAAIAGMALTHTVGRAVWQGLFTSGRPFVRTPKCENQPAFMQGLLMASEEVSLMLALWLAAAGIVAVFGAENRDAFLWSGLLVVQSLPYLAALVVSMINAFPHVTFRRQRRETGPAAVEAAEAAD